MPRTLPSPSILAFASPDSPAPSAARDARALFFGVALFFVAFAPAASFGGDADSMLAVTESLLTHASFAVAPQYGTPGIGGRFYSSHYPLLSIVALPTALLARLAAMAARVPLAQATRIGAMAVNGLITAASAVVVRRIALRLGGTRRSSAIAAMLFVFGGPAIVYARTFFAEPLATLLALAALDSAFAHTPAGTRRASVYAAAAVLAKPSGILVGLACAVAATLAHRPRGERWWPLLGGATGLAAYGIYNALRFGSPLDFGQQHWSGFGSMQLPKGLLGLIASPGFGLIWFAPVVAVVAAALPSALRTRPVEVLPMAILAASYLLLHAAWQSWHGGWSWGPRLVLPGMGALTALYVFLGRRGTMLALSAGGIAFVAAAPTLVASWNRHEYELVKRDRRDLITSAWTIRDSPVLHQWSTAARQIADERASRRGDGPCARLVRPTITERTSGMPCSLRRLDVWWAVIPGPDIVRVLAIVVAILALASSLALLAVPFRGEPSESCGVA